tara:strand:+ start:469 stop:771 length:303 start_codon:yes stop_codon:yes gene_type:complete
MEKVKAGQKVKVHLGSLGNCYGITTGRSVKKILKKREVNVLELRQCDPIPFHEIEMFRDGNEISFKIRYANQVKIYKNEKQIFPINELIGYYKLKKNYFK